MKYIRLTSDLHLEAFYGKSVHEMVEYFVPPDERDVESVLVVAGDLSNKPDQIGEFFSTLEHRFIRVLYVFGNHEMYRHTYNDVPNLINQQFIVHNVRNTICPGNDIKSYVVDGIKFIAGTLWGECSTNDVVNRDLKDMINDFKLITVREYGDNITMSPTFMRKLSREHKSLIRTELAQATEKQVVVVTHHLPTHAAVSPRFKLSTVNGAFVNALDDVWEPNLSPNMFLFGHTHDHQHFVKDGILFKANPVGYRGEWHSPHNNYQERCFIEV